MLSHRSHITFLVYIVCAGLLAQCIAAPTQDYISLLQSKAQTITQNKTELVLLSEVDVPKLEGKGPNEISCMLKQALQSASGFQAVRQGENMNLPTGYRKCAVVSSSGIMQKHQYGAEIDEADVIVRFNEAPTSGFGYIVGNKESIRLVNEKVVHEYLGDHFGSHVHTDPKVAKQMGPGVDYLLTCAVCGVGTKTIMHPDSFKRMQARAAQQDPSLQLFASDLSLETDLFRFIHETYGVMMRTPAGPTTGAIGMVVALSLCDEVVAYGMNDNPNVDPDKVAYHYYQPDRPNIKTSEINQARRWHRSFDAEKDLWRRLATNPVEEIIQDKVVLKGFSQCDAAAVPSQTDAKSQDAQSVAAASSVKTESQKSKKASPTATTTTLEAHSAWNPFR